MLRVAVNYQRQWGVRKAKNLSLISLQNQSEDDLNRGDPSISTTVTDLCRKHFKEAKREGFSEAHEAEHHQEETSSEFSRVAR